MDFGVTPNFVYAMLLEQSLATARVYFSYVMNIVMSWTFDVVNQIRGQLYYYFVFFLISIYRYRIETFER